MSFFQKPRGVTTEMWFRKYKFFGVWSNEVNFYTCLLAGGSRRRWVHETFCDGYRRKQRWWKWFRHWLKFRVGCGRVRKCGILVSLASQWYSEVRHNLGDCCAKQIRDEKLNRKFKSYRISMSQGRCVGHQHIGVGGNFVPVIKEGLSPISEEAETIGGMPRGSINFNTVNLNLESSMIKEKLMHPYSHAWIR